MDPVFISIELCHRHSEGSNHHLLGEITESVVPPTNSAFFFPIESTPSPFLQCFLSPSCFFNSDSVRVYRSSKLTLVVLDVSTGKIQPDFLRCFTALSAWADYIVLCVTGYESTNING